MKFRFNQVTHGFVLLALCCACSSPGSAQPIMMEQARLLADDGGTFDRFASSVGLFGDIAAVGAPYNDEVAQDAGAVYLYQRNPSTSSWTQVQKLTASDYRWGDQFGTTLFLDQNRLLIGARYDDDNGNNSGSAYLFEQAPDSGLWQQSAKIVADLGHQDQNFSVGTLIFGDQLFLGANFDNENGFRAGAVFVFEASTNEGGWNQRQKLVALDGAPESLFGTRLVRAGDFLFVTAIGDDQTATDSGAVYVFGVDSVSGAWVQTQKIKASDASETARFGSSLDASGMTLAIGARGDSEILPAAGAVYLFAYDPTSGLWLEADKVMATNSGVGDVLGTDVIVAGSHLIAGAAGYQDVDPGEGAGYVFALGGSVAGPQLERFVPSVPGFFYRFGDKMSYSNGRVLVSAAGDDTLGSDAGAAYLFVVDLLFSSSFDGIQ